MSSVALTDWRLFTLNIHSPITSKIPIKIVHEVSKFEFEAVVLLAFLSYMGGFVLIMASNKH